MGGLLGMNELHRTFHPNPRRHHTEDIIPKMLALASVMPDETVFYLGSGDGRMVMAAARDFHARVMGAEVRMCLVRDGAGR